MRYRRISWTHPANRSSSSASRSGSCRLDGTDEHRIVGRHVQGPNASHPDIDAARLAGLIGTPLDGTALLHSTSWRWDPAVGLVLTYLCCPDPCPDMGGTMVPTAGRHAGVEENPSRPHHPDVEPSDILHHGIDHLAWLSDHHPHLTNGVREVAPALWDAIRLAGRHRAIQIVDPLPAAAV
ncbi:MAG: hypothetical protein ABJH68_17155 [Ilumatobacter sp.]|uniref:hypothetical protein n=1 Tax=Ilumatobacter sp. TaxID=1967498 RepID=UPI00329979B4